jgi:hypothetical protein
MLEKMEKDANYTQAEKDFVKHLVVCCPSAMFEDNAITSKLLHENAAYASVVRSYPSFAVLENVAFVHDDLVDMWFSFCGCKFLAACKPGDTHVVILGDQKDAKHFAPFDVVSAFRQYFDNDVVINVAFEM